MQKYTYEHKITKERVSNSQPLKLGKDWRLVSEIHDGKLKKRKVTTKNHGS